MTDSDPGSEKDLLLGPRVQLRKLVPEDVSERYVYWMNDPDVNRYLESRFVTHTIESLRNYVASLASSTASFLFGIYDETSRHIGNIKVGPVETVHGRASIGLVIGEKDAWGHGYATESISVISIFAFESLGIRKLTAGCYASNKGAISAFEHAGFEREALLKEHARDGDSAVDVVHLARFATNGAA